MKVDIDNPKQMLSHLLLDNVDVVTAVAETINWNKSGEINCTVQFNDVELPASILEDVLHKLFKQVEDHYSEKYQADAFDQRVEEKAKEIVKEHADNVVEKLYNLAQVLEESGDLIKPHWER